MKYPSKRVTLLILFIAGLFIQYLYLDSIFISPNQTAFTTGGDGYIIYYNLLYHTCWGEGFVLDGMNYPWGEYIFLTDSMACFSIIFSWLNDLGLPMCEYGVGLIHAVVILLTPLTSMFLYLILRHFRVSNWLAFVSSLLICFLSPQIARFLSHFGLSFPFLLPACIWYYLRLKRYKSWDRYLIVIGLMIVFFGLNNPYLGFICSAFLGLSFFFNFIRDRDFSLFVKGASLSLVPLLIILIVVKIGDPFDDRIKQQWGFFYYYADALGLFLGDGTLFNRWFGNIFTIPQIKWESRVSIGVASTVLLTMMLIVSFFKNMRFTLVNKLTELLPIFLASLVLYLYGAHFFIPTDVQTFVEEHMGFLTMFKAAARFLWPAYFVLSIVAVIGFNTFLAYLNQLNKYVAIGFALLFLGVWTAEVGQYVRHRFDGFRFENALNQQNNDLDQIIKDLSLTPDDYQAIYLLPKMQGWNDKLYVNDEWVSLHYGLKLSLKTNIPVINAKLSRMSMRQTILSQQFAAPPLVEKELLEYLDDTKPILLLKSNKASLKEGEQFLVDQADLINRNTAYDLYKLDLNHIKSNKLIEGVRDEFKTLDFDSTSLQSNYAYYHNGFESGISISNPLYGSAKKIEAGFPMITEFDLTHFNKREKHRLSIWVYIDHQKYGLPEWQIEFLDINKELLISETVSSRHTNVFYNNWARVRRTFNMPASAHTFSLSAKTNQPFLIDEMLYMQESDSVFYKLDTEVNRFMFNNYPMELR